MKLSIASVIAFTVLASGCNFDLFTHNATKVTAYGNIAGINTSSSKEVSSSIARDSGAATQIRLALLFPEAPQDGVFNPNNFSFLNSSGIFSTLGTDTKPTTALAQIALRQQATLLCNNQVGTGDQSNIFSTTDILMTGESLPKDPVQILAFAAARNVWLDAYTVDMPEVQALISLYKSALTAVTGASGDLGARRAVCEAAILAPQFWMGGPLTTDVIRKVALEVGRRRPTFAEINEYKTGKLTLSAYVENIQKEPGYLTAVHDWHQAWLGLRNFLPDGDPRGDNRSADARSVDGSSFLNGLEFRITNTPAGANFSEKIFYPVSQHEAYPQSCLPVAQNFDPRTIQLVWEQRDTNPPPPAALANEGWNIIGANVHVDGVSAFKSRLRELYFNRTGQSDAYSTDRDASRALLAQTYGDENGLFSKLCAMPIGTTSWYSCNGVVLLPASLRSTLESEYAAVMSHQSASWTDAKDGAHAFFAEKSQLDTILAWNSDHSHIVHMLTPLSGIMNVNFAWLPVIAPAGFNVDTTKGQSFAAFYGQTDGAWVPLGTIMNWPSAAGNQLRSPISYFQPGWRNLRRYSPSGEQNGYSTVSTWFAGTTVRVCNNLDRFAASCFYRPKGGVAIADYWDWNAAMPNLVDIDGGHGTYFPSFANYQDIGNFKCGQPTAGDIASGSATAYPLGYDYALGGDGAYHYGNLQGLTTLAAAPGVGDDTKASDDYVAMSNIRNDITNEPYHLIDYLVSNNMDYRQLLTANYTCGGKDFARHYQTQGYFLPLAPNQIDGNIGKLGSSCSVPNGDANLFRVEHLGIKLSVNLLKNANSTYQSPSGCNFLTVNTPSKDRSPGQYECVNTSPSVNGTGYGLTDINPPVSTIPERTMAGILTMPAFVAPVMPSPRTLSSRFFIRLLCGDPSMFKPTPEQTAMQSAFVSGRSHLQPQCISCHINLDPLASAFSSSFKYFEGSGLYSMMGEFAPGGQGNFYNMVGLRSGAGNKGQGAFFGQKINGIEELGSAVANSPQFAACVVQKTFQNVMGRPPSNSDVNFLTNETTRFQNVINYNYNKLVEDIVVSNSFTEKQ